MWSFGGFFESHRAAPTRRCPPRRAEYAEWASAGGGRRRASEEIKAKVDDVDPLFPLFRAAVSAPKALAPPPRDEGATRGRGADENAPSNALAGLPPLPPTSRARKAGGRGPRAGGAATGRQRKARGGQGGDAAPRAPTAAELAEEALRQYFCSIEHVQLANEDEEEDETEEVEEDAFGRPASTPVSRRRSLAKRAGVGGDAADSSSVATESGSDAEGSAWEDDAVAPLPPPSAFKRGAWVASGVKARRERGERSEGAAGGAEDLSKAIEDIGALSLARQVDENESAEEHAAGGAAAEADGSGNGVAQTVGVEHHNWPPVAASGSPPATGDATSESSAVSTCSSAHLATSPPHALADPRTVPSRSPQPPRPSLPAGGPLTCTSRFTSRPSDLPPRRLSTRPSDAFPQGRLSSRPSDAFPPPRLSTRPSDAFPPPRFSSRPSDAPLGQLPSRRLSTCLTLAPPHPSDRLSLAPPPRSGRPSLAASRLSLAPLRDPASRRSHGGKRSLAGQPSVAAAWIESVSKAIATEGGGLEAATKRSEAKSGGDDTIGAEAPQPGEGAKSKDVGGATEAGEGRGAQERSEVGGERGVEALARGVAGLSVEEEEDDADALDVEPPSEVAEGDEDAPKREEKIGDEQSAPLLAPTRPTSSSAALPPPSRPQTRSRTRIQARGSMRAGDAARGAGDASAIAADSSPAGSRRAAPASPLPEASGEAPARTPVGRGGAKAARARTPTAEPSASSPQSTLQAPSPATRRSARLAARGASASPQGGVEDAGVETVRPLSSLSSTTPSPVARSFSSSPTTTTPPPAVRVSASLRASPDAADAGSSSPSPSPLSASPAGSSASSPGGSLLDASPLAELLHICGQDDVLSEAQGDLRSASLGLGASPTARTSASPSPEGAARASPSPHSAVAVLAPHLPTMRDFLLACLGEERRETRAEQGRERAARAGTGSSGSEQRSALRPGRSLADASLLRTLPPVRKVGEGTFAEAFLCGRGVIKVMPIEGPGTYNDEPQRRAEDVLPEVAVHKALSSFGDGLRPRSLAPNATAGFVRTLAAGVCQGAYAPELLEAWTAWDERKGSENDDPSTLGRVPAAEQGKPLDRRATGGMEGSRSRRDGGAAGNSQTGAPAYVPQLYMVLVLSNGGVDLESADLERLAREGGALEASGADEARATKHTRAARAGHSSDDASTSSAPLAFLAARSVLLQTTFTLAAAEQACEFEHRDLHWGNVLVANAQTEGEEEGHEERGGGEEEGRELGGEGGARGGHTDGEGSDEGSESSPSSAASRALGVAVPSALASARAPRDLRFRLRGVDVVAPSCGVRVTLIDFTLSRLRGRGSSAAAFCDLGADPAIFEGPAGDPQADAYRRMRALVERDQSWDEPDAGAEASPWARYRPATNAVWLAYLAKTLAAHKLPPRDRAGRAALAAFARRAARATDAARLAWDPLFEGCWKAQAGGEGGGGERPAAAERATVSAAELRA